MKQTLLPDWVVLTFTMLAIGNNGSRGRAVPLADSARVTSAFYRLAGTWIALAQRLGRRRPRCEPAQQAFAQILEPSHFSMLDAVSVC